jgi:CubicO group peptidase (beta-lactamase class C family)
MPMPEASQEQVNQYYSGRLYPEELLEIMSQDQGWFSSKVVPAKGTASPFAYDPMDVDRIEIRDNDRKFDFYDYVSVNRIHGMLVLKDGVVRIEKYLGGISDRTIWKSCSMAKSITSTLVGVAVHAGHIRSLEDPVSMYVDAGPLYEKVSVRQLLRMSSGVRWREDYGDPTSERRRLMDLQKQWSPDGFLKHMRDMVPETPPGQSWKYNTGDSYLVGALLESATGRRVWELLAELWGEIGAEADGYWWTFSPDGMTIAGSGYHASLRDYARFAEFVRGGGKLNGRDLVPSGWFEEASSPFNIGDRVIPYGYMWWLPSDRFENLANSFNARGVFGQFMHINPKQGITAVLLSARSKPAAGSRFEISDEAFFSALANWL